MSHELLCLCRLPGIEALFASCALNLLYQFFWHTEAADKIHAIEGVIDTPPAHSLHQGRNNLICI